jgi:predicted dehydrogenase
MTSEKLRIAFIGAWGHWDSVLQELDSHRQVQEGVQIVALAKALPDDDFSEFLRYRSAQGVPVFNDYRRMLKEVQPQIAVISTRLDQIAPISIDSANAGCHLVSEKPLALTHKSLEQVAHAVQKNKVHCIAMMGNRMHPVLAAARQVVASGQIGDVVLANARKSYKWGTRPEWFGNRALYGGTIGWVGIHGLDFIHTVTGQNFTSVAAMQSNLVHPERPECEDNAALVLQLANGGHATLSIDILRPKAAATHGNDWLRVVGSNGVLEAELAKKRCLVTTHDQPEYEVPVADAAAPFYAEFYDHVRRAITTPPPDMPKAFFLTHTALCARDAADESRVVQILPFSV